VAPVSRAFLIGGGREPEPARLSHLPFADAVRAAGDDRVALIVLDEGDDTDVEGRATALERVGLTPDVHVVAPDRPPRPLGDITGVFVTGGTTPGYQEALCTDPSWLPPDAVYGGFSAGASIAAHQALVGGWMLGALAVCDSDVGEGLEAVELRPGLGLLDAHVDVHCAQWGTLARLVAVVEAGDGTPGWGIDEHTTLELRDGTAVAVHGAGAAWRVDRLDGGGAVVAPRRAGAL
jgi:cyanophycinase